MVEKVERQADGADFVVTGTVRRFPATSRVFVQVFLTQTHGAVATGGGFAADHKTGEFTVTATPDGAGPAFREADALSVMAHATEMWTEPLSRDPATKGVVQVGPQVWKDQWP
jgi:hypothetical protein